MTDLGTLNNSEDFLAQQDVTRPSETTGTWIAATGIAALQFRFSLTKNGAAIGTLTALALERAGTAGRYYAVFDTLDLVAGLTAYLNQRVYLILSKAGDLDGYWVSWLVRDNRAGA